MLLLLLYYFAATASALPLLYSCPVQVPIPHISSSSPVPAQLLPAFCPVLLYSAELCSCPVPALLLSPTLLMLQPRSCFAPALLLPCSWSCQPQFGSLHHHHQHLTPFSARRAPPFMAFYGFFSLVFYWKQLIDIYFFHKRVFIIWPNTGYFRWSLE